MAKIHPQSSSSSASSFSASSSPSLSSSMIPRRKVYTVWMKSLILNGNGCAIYDSNGQIVYRVDNYNRRCNDKVYLMDPRGHILFTILRKKLRVFGRWEGYKSSVSNVEDHELPWFRVSRACSMFTGETTCSVTVGLDKTQPSCYSIKGLKSGCKIFKQTGELVAEVKQKHSSSGIALGDDVLSLMVEPDTDHSLVMGLVVVYGLMNRNM